MTKAILAPLAIVALLSACSQAVDEADDRVESVDLEGTGDTAPPLPPPSPGAPEGVNDGYPDLTPAPLTPEAERTETGARSLLVNWARAIELQEWDQAWRMMSEQDRAKWSREEFAALFSDLAKVTVAVPTGTMEGAAGSSYYTAPVTITGSDAEGRPVRYEGEVVLRRANDVTGASAEQRRWQFDSTELDWTH